MVNAFRALEERGLVEWCSHPEDLDAFFNTGERITAYIGFDPTADSLHVGHLIPIMTLSWLQRMGHRPICLAGGGTGMIGDPSGKSKERNLLSPEAVQENIKGVKKQLEHFMDFDCGENSAIIVNNYDWLKSISFLDFLRDVGKYFSVNYMINKEHVKSRLGDPEKSISYTEFSYTLLQAFDFMHLLESYGCQVQMGGNDQQGNIVSGIDLIRKRKGEQVYGWTNPLLLTSSGTKFGKTEGGAVWLDPKRTSPYRFYQFWINTEDEMVEKLLKFFTFLPLDEIKAIMEKHAAAPEKREAQKRLAWEVTALVHSSHAADTVARASEILFSGEITHEDMTEEMMEMLAEEVPYETLDVVLPVAVVDILASVGACKSKGEAKRLLRGGGVYINGDRIEDEAASVDEDHLIGGRHIFVRLGKKRFFLIEIKR